MGKCVDQSLIAHFVSGAVFLITAGGYANASAGALVLGLSVRPGTN
jgi:hypothetical protein